MCMILAILLVVHNVGINNVIYWPRCLSIVKFILMLWCMEILVLAILFHSMCVL
jgi:hypothetical protein